MEIGKWKLENGNWKMEIVKNTEQLVVNYHKIPVSFRTFTSFKPLPGRETTLLTPQVQVTSRKEYWKLDNSKMEMPSQLETFPTISSLINRDLCTYINNMHSVINLSAN